MVTVEIGLFWGMTPCSWVEKHNCFGGTYNHLRRISSSSLKTEVEVFIVSFSLIVENYLRREERHLDFSDPHVEETLVSYMMRVMSLLTLANICPATVVMLRCCWHRCFKTAVDLTDIQR
jgi:hypothetical protein